MIDELIRRLEAIAKGKTIAVAAAAYAAFVLILNVGGAKLEEIAGSNAVLDLRQHFTEEEAFALFTKYGEEGRRLYFRLELVDILYPLAYGAFLALCLAYLLPRVFSPPSAVRRLALLPALAVLMDYAENVGLITMVTTYPERWPRLGTAAGIFNVVKWSLVGVCVALAVTSLLGWGLKMLRRRREA